MVAAHPNIDIQLFLFPVSGITFLSPVIFCLMEGNKWFGDEGAAAAAISNKVRSIASTSLSSSGRFLTCSATSALSLSVKAPITYNSRIPEDMYSLIFILLGQILIFLCNSCFWFSRCQLGSEALQHFPFG